MKQEIKSAENIFSSSMSRLLAHLDTENVATITAFVTSDDPRRPTKPYEQSDRENRQANINLGKELSALRYGYSKIDGYYKESGNEKPTLERSFFVVCPINVAYENFRKTLIALARKYEQQSVLIWSHEKQQAYFYGTTDYVSYTQWDVFNNFNIDRAKDEVWSELKSHNFVFGSRDFILQNATELEDKKYGGGPADMLGAKYWRKGLLEEYSGEPDDANEIISL